MPLRQPGAFSDTLDTGNIHARGLDVLFPSAAPLLLLRHGHFEIRSTSSHMCPCHCLVFPLLSGASTRKLSALRRASDPVSNQPCRSWALRFEAQAKPHTYIEHTVPSSSSPAARFSCCPVLLAAQYTRSLVGFCKRPPPPTTQKIHQAQYLCCSSSCQVPFSATAWCLCLVDPYAVWCIHHDHESEIRLFETLL